MEKEIIMKPTIKIYHKDDPQQYRDEILFWRNKSSVYKIQALEVIRYQWYKLNQNDEITIPRFRRVLSIIKRT